MSIPSPIKIKKGNVEYVSSVDRANYMIFELARAALRDVGKFISAKTRLKIKKRTGRLAKNIQYWVRKKECNLQVGFKPGGFYGGFQEFGTSKQPKIGALKDSTYENIDEIRKIEAQYLSFVEDEMKALSKIKEGDEV